MGSTLPGGGSCPTGDTGEGGCSGASAPDASAVSPDDSPLRQYLLALGDDLSDEQRAAQTAQVEEAVAACMAEEGFDYVPVTYDDGTYDPDEWRPDDPDWVARWGYGVVDAPGLREMLAAQDEGDENTAYDNSLSPSEQTAYAETLWGPMPTDEEIAASLDGTDLFTWDEQGCQGRADHEVRGDDLLDSGQYLTLRNEIIDFQRTQFSAPEYAELNAEWSDCMADAGHPGYENHPAVKESFSTRVSDISMTQTEADHDDPRVVALQDEEVETALADLDCREKTDYEARSLVIQYAQEERFIADHRAEFDQLESDAAQAG